MTPMNNVATEEFHTQNVHTLCVRSTEEHIKPRVLLLQSIPTDNFDVSLEFPGQKFQERKWNATANACFTVHTLRPFTTTRQT